MILIIIKHEFLVARVVTGMDRPTWKPHSVITCASHSGCSDSETTETPTMNQRRSKKNETRMNQRVIRAEHALCHCVVRNKESDQLLKIKNLINLPPNRSKLVAARTSLHQGEWQSLHHTYDLLKSPHIWSIKITTHMIYQNHHTYDLLKSPHIWSIKITTHMIY